MKYDELWWIINYSHMVNYGPDLNYGEWWIMVKHRASDFPFPPCPMVSCTSCKAASVGSTRFNRSVAGDSALETRGGSHQMSTISVTTCDNHISSNQHHPISRIMQAKGKNTLIYSPMTDKLHPYLTNHPFCFIQASYIWWSMGSTILGCPATTCSSPPSMLLTVGSNKSTKSSSGCIRVPCQRWLINQQNKWG